MQIIGLGECDRWDAIVRSFANYDVYYLSGYVKGFFIHGDGEPVLLYHVANKWRAACVLMIRDVADDPLFQGMIQHGSYKDAVTPYGYGGFIVDGELDPGVLASVFMSTLRKLGVISVFFRFHPILNNAASCSVFIDTLSLGRTISMDLESKEIIWDNIISKNRNMIRKAEKHGIEICHGRGIELLDKFREIYNHTMDHDNADRYYYFGKEFYRSIDFDLRDNYEVFYARYGDVIIAMSIILFASGRLNYHLSGSLFEYRGFAPSNLLLYKAAVWGAENGMKTFHLGGGLGAGEDNLYKFKASFNRNSDCRFVVGRTVVDRDKYNYLLGLRNLSTEQKESTGFFPIYRVRFSD